MAKPTVFPQLDPSKSAGGGGMLGPVPKTKTGGYIETSPLKQETPGPAPEATDQEILASIEAQDSLEAAPDPGAEAWRQAALFLIDRGMNPPKTQSKFRAWLADNDSASYLLAEAKPLLARELSIEIELPTPLFRLESSSVQASAKLGRELLDLEMSIEDMVKLVPSKADVIRLSIKEWEKDQIRIMRERLDEAKLTAQQAKERTLKMRVEAGAPGPRAQADMRKAAAKKLLRESGFSAQGLS